MIETNPSKEWHQQSPEEVIALLRSSESGLTAEEAAKRLSKDGVNELTEGKRISVGLIFLSQFKSLVI
jgi:Ca2+-transporting ATPase